MKIIVPIKRVVDANVRIRILPDETGVDTDNATMSMNPFCEIAVEAAVRFKEAGLAKEVTVVSVGLPHCEDILRSAMAMGADRAILVTTNEALHPLAIARVLKVLVTRESPDLVILGKQSIDNDNNQTGQMLAGLLGWAQGTFASAITIMGGRVEVTREIDGGMETLSLLLPAVITTDLRLNEPRYLKLPDIIKARKKPLHIINITDLDVDTCSKQKVLKTVEPPGRKAGVKLGSVRQLVDTLKGKGVIK